MRVVYKYNLPAVGAEEKIPLNDGWKPLMVGPDPQGVWCVWFEVDLDRNLQTHRITIIGTGRVIQDNYQWVGSFVRGPYVWHVYCG